MLRALFRFLSFPPCAVRALPAVPLIRRFVCAFKHYSPGRGVEQRKATDGKRRNEGRTPQEAEKEEQGARSKEREAERKRQFSMTRKAKYLEWPGEISSEPPRSKVRVSSLQTSPSYATLTFNPSPIPGSFSLFFSPPPFPPSSLSLSRSATSLAIFSRLFVVAL